MIILHSIFYFKSAGHDDKLIIDPKAIINKEALFFISTVLLVIREREPMLI